MTTLWGFAGVGVVEYKRDGTGVVRVAGEEVKGWVAIALNDATVR